MPVIKVQDPESISERLDDDEGLVHTHYGSSERVGISLKQDKEDDDEYEGEPYSCPWCEFNADYTEATGEEYSYHYEPFRDVYVCDHDGCGWDHEDESVVKSHYTREHKED